MKKNKKKCSVCHKTFPLRALFPLMIIREAVWSLILKDIPHINRDGYICDLDYKKYKLENINQMLEEEKGSVSALEHEVIESLGNHDILTENVQDTYTESLTLGEKIADRVSAFGGSWKFIILFLSFLFGWMFLNTYILLQDQYDPYPYILLNLILSCVAALQAPIIMMSQNRRSERDHIQAENDYKVNLKSELQIRQLNMKLDQFMVSQWDTLIGIQNTQTDLMNEIHGSIIKKENSND